MSEGNALKLRHFFETSRTTWRTAQVWPIIAGMIVDCRLYTRIVSCTEIVSHFKPGRQKKCVACISLSPNFMNNIKYVPFTACHKWNAMGWTSSPFQDDPIYYSIDFRIQHYHLTDVMWSYMSFQYDSKKLMILHPSCRCNWESSRPFCPLCSCGWLCSAD